MKKLYETIDALGQEGKYQEQAAKFLELTGSSIRWTFVGYRDYWTNSDYDRSQDLKKRKTREPVFCWKWSIVRTTPSNRAYSGSFGNSVNNVWDSCLGIGHPMTKTLHLAEQLKSVTDTIKPDGTFKPKDKAVERNNTFYGDGIRVNIPHPTAYDLLACLQKSDPGSFENFCPEFGYDSDSRTAERTYKAVKEEFQGLERLFTDDEIQALQAIA